MGAEQKAQAGLKKERDVPMFSIVSEHTKRSKERYLLGQDKNQQIFGVIPFVKLQNDS